MILALLCVCPAYAERPSKVEEARTEIVAYFGEEPQEESVKDSRSYVSYNLYFKAPNGKLQFLAVIFHLVQQNRVFAVMAVSEPFLHNFNTEVALER